MRAWAEKYLIKSFFGWENFKWFVREIRATFSNQPSYFARKRIESFILFVNAMVILDSWCIRNWDNMDGTTIIAVYSAQMIYAGYQVTQIRKDMQVLKQETSKQGGEQAQG